MRFYAKALRTLHSLSKRGICSGSRWIAPAQWPRCYCRCPKCQSNSLSSKRRSRVDSQFTLTSSTIAVERIHDGIPLSKVPALTPGSTNPKAATALNDAIGNLIRSLSESCSGPRHKVLCVILTDGEENAHAVQRRGYSRMVRYGRIRHGWQFMFLGPETCTCVRQSIGIPKVNTAGFRNNSRGAAALDRTAEQQLCPLIDSAIVNSLSSSKAEMNFANGAAVAVPRSSAKPLHLCVCACCSGQLRRGKRSVGDVELLYISQVAEQPEDLFSSKSVALADIEIDELLRGASSPNVATRPAILGAKNKLVCIAEAEFRWSSTPPPKKTGGIIWFDYGPGTRNVEIATRRPPRMEMDHACATSTRAIYTSDAATRRNGFDLPRTHYRPMSPSYKDRL